MSKSEVLELSRARSKEIFKRYLVKESGDFDILDDEIEVIGLKEYENKFRVMIKYQKIKDVYIEFVLMKKSGRLTHTLFERI